MRLGWTGAGSVNIRAGPAGGWGNGATHSIRPASADCQLVTASPRFHSCRPRRSGAHLEALGNHSAAAAASPAGQPCRRRVLLLLPAQALLSAQLASQPCRHVLCCSSGILFDALGRGASAQPLDDGWHNATSHTQWEAKESIALPNHSPPPPYLPPPAPPSRRDAPAHASGTGPPPRPAPLQAGGRGGSEVNGGKRGRALRAFAGSDGKSPVQQQQ